MPTCPSRHAISKRIRTLVRTSSVSNQLRICVTSDQILQDMIMVTEKRSRSWPVGCMARYSPLTWTMPTIGTRGVSLQHDI